jgi:hypothetical protein
MTQTYLCRGCDWSCLTTPNTDVHKHPTGCMYEMDKDKIRFYPHH